MEIETGVELPTVRRSKYPFGKMDVGESFFVQDDPAKTLPRLRQSASLFAKKEGLGKRYVVRESDKDGVAGVRVWRTE